MGIEEYRTKEGRRYSAVLVINQTKVKRQGGFRTKREAKTWLLKERQDWSPEELEQQLQTDITFFDLAQIYLDEAQNRLKKNTYIYKKTVISRFLSFLQDREPTRDLIKEFLSLVKDKISPTSANKYLVEIITLFNWAIHEEKYTYANPAIGISRFSSDKYVRYIPPKEHIDKVFDVAEGWEVDFLTILFHTAARISEIRLLRWEDVDLLRQTITLWTSKRKGGNKEPRTQAVTSSVMQILYRRKAVASPGEIYVFTNPNTNTCYDRQTKAMKDLFVNLCKKAGVPHFSAHCLRHYIATHLTETKKVGVRETQKLLGHKNISTTEKYLQELSVDKSLISQIELIADTKNLGRSAE